MFIKRWVPNFQSLPPNKSNLSFFPCSICILKEFSTIKFDFHIMSYTSPITQVDSKDILSLFITSKIHFSLLVSICDKLSINPTFVNFRKLVELQFRLRFDTVVFGFPQRVCREQKISLPFFYKLRFFCLTRNQFWLCLFIINRITARFVKV